jgi:glycosyltransferase involved in cell wall biosynthesis
VPAYDEEKQIADEIADLARVLATLSMESEILVVDDGSTDRTAELAARAGARVISHPENRGYGAALKTGIRHARFPTIVITDADGTYPADAIPAMLEKASAYDMVVGARTGASVADPLARRPAKWLLQRLASYLAERRIPDLNSGLRVLKRPIVERFEHLLPSGFSFTTTITLAMLCNDYLVWYHPIDYRTRVGDSKIRALDAYQFFLLIVRTIVYFNPLRVFLPIGAVLFVAACAKLVYDLLASNISDTTVLGFLGAIVVWAIGLLSDQIARTGLGARSA